MIETSSVTLSFDASPLFDDVNVKFLSGNCYGLIGANGAGKSTFMKILSGDLEPTKGQVIIEKGKRDGRLDANAPMSADALEKLGVDKKEAEQLGSAFRQNETTRALLKQDDVLAGFGNNGGEEFLSHMMTSESLVVTGGKDWKL